MTQGLSPNCSVNKSSMARTAPNPSKIAPNPIAARMIHMNMQVIARVWRIVVSKTCFVIRPLNTAVNKAARAPIAELSTRLVQPLTKGTIITAKIPSGSSPAFNKRSFSDMEMFRCSSPNAGPSWG